MVRSSKALWDQQHEVCAKYGAVCLPADIGSIAGVARTIGSGLLPVNGLRHPPTDDTSGWYLWAGDFSTEDNFFEPIHVLHVADRAPEVMIYLGLPPGGER
jgi:hypothetical protein